MPFPVKLLALRPGSAGPGWQEWHVDFRLMGLSGPGRRTAEIPVSTSRTSSASWR